MFGQMIAELKDGRLPDNNLLRRRFEAALIKKMGVIRAPYSFWPGDPKINPPAKQLLWTAILLQDRDNFQMVEAIITAELEEKQRAKGQPVSPRAMAAEVLRIRQEYIHELLELAPDQGFRKQLRQLAEAVTEVQPGKFAV